MIWNAGWFLFGLSYIVLEFGHARRPISVGKARETWALVQYQLKVRLRDEAERNLILTVIELKYIRIFAGC